MDSHQEVSKQVLYYLSDDNLQRDQFFYDKITSNPDHFVDIESFLNCNKIKKLGYQTTQKLAEALKKSNELEISKDSTLVKKKDMTDVPEFIGKKKVKVDNDGNQIVNPYSKIQTVIFTLTPEKEQTIPFKIIQESLLKNHNTFTPYVRFNKTQGHFAVQKKNCPDNLVQKLQKQGLKVGDAVLKITKAEGEKLNEFWEKHGHHYSGIIDNLRKQFDKKHKNDKKQHNVAKKVQTFKFGGETYDDINKLKSLFKNILARNPNNTPLKQKQQNLVKQLLSFHKKSEQKLKDFKHIVVDVNPIYADTRCFFVVRNDDSREDFSVLKCIAEVENKYSV